AWTRPLARGDGYDEDLLWVAGERLGERLPAALRDAYLLFGRRADLTACQDPLLPPDRLCAETGPWGPRDYGSACAVSAVSACAIIWLRAGAAPLRLFATRQAWVTSRLVALRPARPVMAAGSSGMPVVAPIRAASSNSRCRLAGFAAIRAPAAANMVSMTRYPA